jgi:hypothetical protein
MTSCLLIYAPGWLKNDVNRFPCVRKKKGELVAAISAFSDAAVAADANTFGQLMPQPRQIDARKQTVLMVQAENEAGLFRVAMRAQD